MNTQAKARMCAIAFIPMYARKGFAGWRRCKVFPSGKRMLLPVALRPIAPGAERLRDCLVEHIIAFAHRCGPLVGAFAGKAVQKSVL